MAIRSPEVAAMTSMSAWMRCADLMEIVPIYPEPTSAPAIQVNIWCTEDCKLEVVLDNKKKFVCMQCKSNFFDRILFYLKKGDLAKC